jgi:hypothetical protein
LHAGDTYTNISEGGYSYKWVKNGSTWEWMVITDSAVLAALEELKKSLAVAIDGKSTTFYDKFPSNYNKGDAWI